MFLMDNFSAVVMCTVLCNVEKLRVVVMLVWCCFYVMMSGGSCCWMMCGFLKCWGMRS